MRKNNWNDLVVHHKDGNHFNDSPENRVTITRSKHTQLHHKDKVLSEETKRKIGEANRGRIHSHTKESKEKMSRSHMGHSTSEETKAKIRKANFGQTRNLSEETRRRMQGNRNALGHTMTHTPEAKRAIGKSSNERMLRIWKERREGKREMPKRQAFYITRPVEEDITKEKGGEQEEI